MEKVIKTFSFLSKDLKNKILDAIPAISNKMASRTSYNIIDPTSVSAVIRNPKLPICCLIPNGNLELGSLISIYATIKAEGKKFRLDFFLDQCEHSDGQQNDLGEENGSIAFHFNPRIGDNSDGRDVVVMNSFSNGRWGQEERNYELFPFSPGNPFRMMILVENECFKIAVDGRHSYEFEHRFDFKNIVRMHIEGELVLDLVEFRKELRYLPRSLSTSSSTVTSSISEETHSVLTEKHIRKVDSPVVPYMDYDPNLSKPCNIYIAGMLPHHVRENFVINLAKSDKQHTIGDIVNIPIHISIRADIQTIVRNTMTNGIWGEEELYLEGPFQLIPGTHFDLMISNKSDKVVVAINGQSAFEYKYRHDPKTINVLQINGGVVLTSIHYEFEE